MIAPIPSPLSGVITNVNDLIASRPRVVNDSPYDAGWIVRLQPDNLQPEKRELSKLGDIAPLLRQRISEYHVRCFKAVPDYDMVEVGVECGAVLTRLNELIATMPVGTVVHIVSDDPTAYVEIVAWSDRMGQELVEWRRDDHLYHFLVRKLAS